MSKATTPCRASLLLFVATLFVGFSANAQNLLTNPGCESGGDPPTGWLEDDGQDDWRCADATTIPGINPADGTYYFLQNATNPADVFNSLRQLVDLSSYSTAIDAGTEVLDFSGKYRDDDGNSPDVLRFRIKFYDGSFAAINGGANDWSSPDITGNSTFNYILYESVSNPVPPGARWADVVIECRDNNASSYCDYTFDTFLVEFGTPLAVELASFEGRADGSAVVLSWSSASESNFAGYDIERATGNGGWQSMQYVEATGNPQGGASYQQRIGGLAPGVHHFRLRQIDLDGSVSFSNTIEVAVLVSGVSLSAPYPNPFATTANFVVSVPTEQHVRVSAYDILGRRVATLHDGIVQADAPLALTLDGAGLAEGLYVIRAKGTSFDGSRTVVLSRDR